MSSKLVFITGATGFIGAQVLDFTLRAGYRVQVSVRKSEQIQIFKARYPSYSTSLDFAIAPDITNSKLFVDALQGVDYVIHLASPMPGRGEGLRKDYVEPAVKGTEAILTAVNQHSSIKTMIIESSILALTPVNVFTLSDVSVTDNTNEIMPVDLDMKFPPKDPSYGIKYNASKILAHQASRDFAKYESPHFKIITFHPVFVLGPDLNQTSSSNIGGINAMIWNSLGSTKPPIAPVWVHVPTGTEFILSAQPFEYQAAVEYIKENYPTVDVKFEGSFIPPWKVDTNTAKTKLGMQWKDWKAIIDDVFKQQLDFPKYIY